MKSTAGKRVVIGCVYLVELVKGAPPAILAALRGRVVRALGGRGKHIRLRASDISARASTPLDERRRYLAMQKFNSGSDTTKAILKTRRGVVRGRTPKARTTKAKTHKNY